MGSCLCQVRDADALCYAATCKLLPANLRSNGFWALSSSSLESIFSMIKYLNAENQGKMQWQTLQWAALIRIYGEKPGYELTDAELKVATEPTVQEGG